MNGIRRYTYLIHLIILLFLVLSIFVGCTSNASRLASLKANYNEGKWGYVLCTVRSKGAYCADEVIEAAGEDILTADQAKLIKARALMHAFIQDKLAAGVDVTKDPDIAQALKFIKELSSKDFNLNWMNVELMAAIADYFYLSGNYSAAFDAYDYLLNNANFEWLNASHRQYIRRWVEMKRQLSGMVTSDAYNEYANEQFKKTYAVVVKEFPDDISVVKASIIILDDEGQSRRAIHLAMLARFTAAKNPKTQKQFVREIDDLVDSILENLEEVDPQEKSRLTEEYNRFRQGWDATTLPSAK